MFINSLVLAIASSIDSLGIGITYGLKNTKISFFCMLILFGISFGVSVISLLLGNFIKNLFPDIIIDFLGSGLLIVMGFWAFLQAMKNDCKNFDLDNSKSIDYKEACILGFALSLDSFCICIGGSIIGINASLFPFLISSFQLLFLYFGTFCGSKLASFSKLPDKIWSIISAFLLVCIGLAKLFLDF